MRRYRDIAAIATLVGAAASARAEHEHGPIAPSESEPVSAYAAGIAFVAASYETMFYGGNYEGAVPSFRWSRGRFGAAASLPLYRLVGNGRTTFGIGDAIVHGQATLAGDRALAFGVVLAVGLPTGDSRPGLGMGHAMLMPAGFVSAELGWLALVGSAGYGRALGSAHTHGDDPHAWPLVDPMNESEITLSGSADIAIARAWRVGTRLAGAIATSADRQSRLIAGGRAAWTSGRFETGIELQAGLVGDPFEVRGVVQIAVRF